MSDSNKGNKPSKSFSSGKVRGAVWIRQTMRNGQSQTDHSIKINKNFKNKDGDFQETNYYFPEDIEHLENVIKQVRQAVPAKKTD